MSGTVAGAAIANQGEVFKAVVAALPGFAKVVEAYVASPESAPAKDALRQKATATGAQVVDAFSDELGAATKELLKGDPTRFRAFAQSDVAKAIGYQLVQAGVVFGNARSRTSPFDVGGVASASGPFAAGQELHSYSGPLNQAADAFGTAVANRFSGALPPSLAGSSYSSVTMGWNLGEAIRGIRGSVLVAAVGVVSELEDRAREEHPGMSFIQGPPQGLLHDMLTTWIQNAHLSPDERGKAVYEGLMTRHRDHFTVLQPIVREALDVGPAPAAA
ncbi:MAG: hypothetical protein ACKVPX_14115 [Myxococcaceae bacterium]